MQERQPTVFSKGVVSKVLSQTALLLGCFTFLLLPSAQAAGLFKWVDEDGQVRYGDRLPASQAKRGHQQLNSQGVVIGEQDAEITEEQKQAREQAKIEEAKRKEEEAKRLAEEARLAALQAEKDRVLLMTFSSEKELTAVFDDRAEVIDSVINLIEKSIATTEEQLGKLQENAEITYTSKGKDIPGGLAQRIEFAERKIENRTEQLILKQSEKARLMETYQRDLARFRILSSDSQN